jgi:hypothetical protein
MDDPTPWKARTETRAPAEGTIVIKHDAMAKITIPKRKIFFLP